MPAAIVTGAGRGIGRAIALALAGAGYSVGLLARSVAELEGTAVLAGAAGGRALACKCDVTNFTEVEAAAASCRRDLGPIDLLVNNAGSHAGVGLPWEVDPSLWWRDVEVTLRGTFHCSRAVLPAMIERGAGRIVNIASGAALEPRPHSSGYAAGKAAVLRLTDSMEAATAARGVHHFAVHPGGVLTGLTRQILASEAGKRAYPAWQSLDWQPAGRAADLILAIASGRLDPLAGCYLDAAGEIETLLEQAENIQATGTLTLRLREPGEPAR